MNISELDYPVLEDRIATEPVFPREDAKLLVLDRRRQGHDSFLFRDLPKFLKSGDALVLNSSKVLPSRLVGTETEVLLLGRGEGITWRALSRKLRKGQRLRFPKNLEAEVLEKNGEGEWLLKFHTEEMDAYLQEYGTLPLPPYILKRRERLGEKSLHAGDLGNYQTVYAEVPGSVAAPTAGLHFSRELLLRIESQGVRIFRIMMHLGWGSFKPIFAQEIEKHRMHREYFEVAPEAWKGILDCKAHGGRVIAAGTSTVRVLETVSAPGCGLSGWSDLFIYPGIPFRCVDAVLTNFHWPRSTLFMLVCARLGTERAKQAYAEAFARGFRLFSYGDAMLITP